MFGYRKHVSMSKLFASDHKGKDPMSIAVVCELTCDRCFKVYIGQTHLYVNHSMKQHKEG